MLRDLGMGWGQFWRSSILFWRIWHFSKTMPTNWTKIKHMGSAFVVCFLSLWDPMFWLCFCMLCVCVFVCLFVCVVWNAENMHGSLHVIFMLCFFGVWRCFFEGWANNKLNISQTESTQQEVEILLLSLLSYFWSKLITKCYLNLGPGI